MNDTVKIKLLIETGFAGCDHEDFMEIDKEDWDSMTKDEQNRFLDNLAREFRDDYISCAAWVVEDEDED